MADVGTYPVVLEASYSHNSIPHTYLINFTVNILNGCTPIVVSYSPTTYFDFNYSFTGYYVTIQNPTWTSSIAACPNIVNTMLDTGTGVAA